jgi:outer membrane protein OmpA-like peptidoglycan-associated protein
MRYLKSVAQTQKFAESSLKGSEMSGAPTAKTAGPKRQISAKVYNIVFDTGRATFRPQSTAVLEGLVRDLSVSTNTAVEINGHTDNVGNPASNMALSEARAFAVKKWLNRRAARLFPDGRVQVVAYGSTRPLVPNSSPEGRAKNRRVEIKVKAAQ